MHKEIVYTDHLEFRLKQRNIPHELPKVVLQNAKEYYFDKMTGYYVAIANVDYKGRRKEFIVVFEIEDKIVLITIHPIRNEQKVNRIKSGRWIRVEVEL